jgi:hypothetical protein
VGALEILVVQGVRKGSPSGLDVTELAGHGHALPPQDLGGGRRKGNMVWGRLGSSAVFTGYWGIAGDPLKSFFLEAVGSICTSLEISNF